MNTVLIVLLVVLIFGLGFVIYLLFSKKDGTSSESLGMLKQDLQGLQQLINQSQSVLSETGLGAALTLLPPLF